MPTFDGLIENKSWTCPFCETTYDDLEDAQVCFESPVEEQKFNVGDVVFVKQRWPNDYKRPYVKRKIVDVCEGFEAPSFLWRNYAPKTVSEIPHLFCHRRQYILDLDVEIGDGSQVGSVSCPITQEHLRTESEVSPNEVEED